MLDKPEYRHLSQKNGTAVDIVSQEERQFYGVIIMSECSSPLSHESDEELGPLLTHVYLLGFLYNTVLSAGGRTQGCKTSCTMRVHHGLMMLKVN